MSAGQSQNTDGGSWWNRPCGAREVLVLALPLVISMASWTVMNFADRMFLLWHSPQEMAAALPAGALYFSIFCFPLGLASYANTFVSQYYGAKRNERIGLAVWQAVCVGIVFTPIMIATIPIARQIFFWAGHQAEIMQNEITYYQIVTVGGGGGVIAAALSSFYTGQGRTRVVMIVDSLASLLNIILDYLLIFGHAGLPEMGIAGAALATTISQWFKAALYWKLVMTRHNETTCGVFSGRRWDWALMRRLWYFGAPNGLQLFIEIIAITTFILFLGALGEHALVSTTLAFNVNSVAFVPMLGLGLAVSTIVGQQLGKDRSQLAARSAVTGLQLALIYSAVMAALYVLIPDLFLFGHAAGTSPETFHNLRDTVVVLLRFVAAYCLLDATQLVFVSALKGAGDTRFVLITALLTSAIPIGAVLIGIRLGGGLYWCWIVLTVWITALAIIYSLRFWQGHWRKMRVIEPDLLPQAAELPEPEAA